MNSTVAFVTLGCKTNQFESAAMSEQLQLAGYNQVDFEDGAELVVVNTCTVTAATDAQSRNLIRRARRLNPAARVVVTGCYAQIDPERLRQLPGVSLVLGNQEKAHLLEYLTTAPGSGQVAVSDIRNERTIEPLSLQTFDQRSRAFVQIQNGCNAFCSYCIIPYARGRSRSVPLVEVVNQVEQLSANGYPEIVLTGIHIGCYGQDLESKTDLLGLLRAIETSGFSGRLRLGSIEPTELTVELYRYIADSAWICPHFHIPLQAGDDQVLMRMNRHYTAEYFLELVEDVQRLLPDSAIGLDVITGFPGETSEDFANTYRLLEQLPFSHLHVFPFSKREGTPAAQMSGQVPVSVAKQRAAQLRQLGEDKYAAYCRRFIGSELELVIEGGEVDGLRRGLAGNYLPVRVVAGKECQGTLQKALIKDFRDDTLFGELL